MVRKYSKNKGKSLQLEKKEELEELIQKEALNNGSSSN